MLAHAMENVLFHVTLVRDWFDWVFSPASLVVAVAAFVVAKRTHEAQKLHDRQSVLPILNITVGDYEENLYVRITNNGVGPAKVQGLSCACDYEQHGKYQSDSNLYEIMPTRVIVGSVGQDNINRSSNCTSAWLMLD